MVTAAADAVDAYDGLMSLREAIGYVQSGLIGPGTIIFAGEASATIIFLTGGAPVIDSDVSIDGGGMDFFGAFGHATGVEVNGSRLDRIFDVTGGTLSLTGMRLNERAALGEGGGIRISGDAGLILDTVVMSNNLANGPGGALAPDVGGTSFGGGVAILDDATLSARNTPFFGNYAMSGGGTLHVEGMETIVESAMTGNQALSGGGGAALSRGGNSVAFNGDGDGGSGGVLAEARGVVIILDSTIIGNDA